MTALLRRVWRWVTTTRCPECSLMVGFVSAYTATEARSAYDARNLRTLCHWIATCDVCHGTGRVQRGTAHVTRALPKGGSDGQ